MSTNIQTRQSTKTKVEDFLKSSPNCKDFLTDLIEKKEIKMNEEMEKYKKEALVEKAKEFIQYDTANFKTSSSEGFKYKLELLNKDDSDYKLLESSFDTNHRAPHNMLYSIRHEMTACKSDENERILNIFRVVPIDKTLKESNTSSCSNILLLHGTKAPNVEGILRTGFKPSQTYGPGVYLTDDFG